MPVLSLFAVVPVALNSAGVFGGHIPALLGAPSCNFLPRIITSTVLVPPHDLRLLLILLYSDSHFHVLVGVLLVCYDILTRCKELVVKT